MMKKLLLASAVLAAATTAQAQVAEMTAPSPNGVFGNVGRELPVSGNRTFTPPMKSTAAHSRLYNMADHIAISKPDIYQEATFPYVFGTGNGRAIYNNGAGGILADTIEFTSYGVVLHPQWSEFNDRNTYPTDTFIDANSTYSLDSVYIYGFYGRNSAKVNVVDTMIFSAVYGGFDTTSNVTTRYRYIAATLGQSFPYNPYGVDTLPFASVFYNSATLTARQNPGNSAAPAVLTYKMPLTATMQNNDTISNGLNVFKWAPALQVPAGKLVAVTASFKNGDPNFVPNDTVFRGSVNPAEPYKYGMFRPWVVNESTTDPVTQSTQIRSEYRPGSWNTGIYRLFNSTSLVYTPNFGFYSTASQEGTLQWPVIDMILTKTGNAPGGVKNTVTGITVNAYPNPVADVFTVPVSVKAGGNVTVKISNALGQVLATQNFAKVAASQTVEAEFNLSGFANGMYFYTVEAAGERVTSRVVVSH